MGRVVKRIVLTGGPCAGKSDSLEIVEKFLRDRGYVVYTVQESATELIKSGIKPFGDNAISMVSFQDIIMKYQLYKEKLVNDVSNKFNDDMEIIILYDRGLMDNKAYISEDDFNDLLIKYNLKECDILDRYDLVIHLETAAKGNCYTKENNEARSEDKIKAIEMDNKNYYAWSKHNNLEYVKFYDDFKDKQRELLSFIDKNVCKSKRLVLK